MNSFLDVCHCCHVNTTRVRVPSRTTPAYTSHRSCLRLAPAGETQDCFRRVWTKRTPYPTPRDEHLSIRHLHGGRWLAGSQAFNSKRDTFLGIYHDRRSVILLSACFTLLASRMARPALSRRDGASRQHRVWQSSTGERAHAPVLDIIIVRN